MITCPNNSESVSQGEKDVLLVNLNKPVVGRVVVFVLLCRVAVIAIIGAGTPVVFWGIWSIFAPVLKFLEYSRFWQDIIAGPFWALLITAFILKISDIRDELSSDGEFYVSFADIFWESPLLLIAGAVAGIIFVATAIWASLLAGIAVLLSLAIIILGAWLISRLFVAIVISLAKCFVYLVSGEDEDEWSGSYEDDIL